MLLGVTGRIVEAQFYRNYPNVLCCPVAERSIRDVDSWHQLHADQEYFLLVKIRRKNAKNSVSLYWSSSIFCQTANRLLFLTHHSCSGAGSICSERATWTLTYDLFNFQKRDDKALTPRFPKPKLEGWFLVLADREKKELVALKRVSTLRSYSTESLSFFTPEKVGK